MADAFGRLEADLAGWQYTCAGALGDVEADRAYLARVRAAASASCELAPNLSRAALKAALASAKIFWHAAGLGESASDHPERSEHFGVATVEAMAAGCVPIVHNTGGQREIVQDGLNGFLWNSLDELTRITTMVARDEELRSRVSEAARQRARAFGTEHFLHSMVSLIHAVTNAPSRSLARASAT
jgi:glycosyltransferase involved in cell wall biosynthesis